MASLNKVQLIGNLGRDPETRYSADGAAITNIAIATTDSWKDKATGEKKENTEWHRIVFFGKLAEIAGEYLRKGGSVYVEGKLRTRKWTDKEGVERYTTEIVGDQMLMLGTKNGGAKTEQVAEPAQASGAGGIADMDSDIPFAPLPSTYAI